LQFSSLRDVTSPYRVHLLEPSADILPAPYTALLVAIRRRTYEHLDRQGEQKRAKQS
jgi:hypothetical protein